MDASGGWGVEGSLHTMMAQGGGAFQVYFGALQVYFIEGVLFHSTKCFLIGISF